MTRVKQVVWVYTASALMKRQVMIKPLHRQGVYIAALHFCVVPLETISDLFKMYYPCNVIVMPLQMGPLNLVQKLCNSSPLHGTIITINIM